MPPQVVIGLLNAATDFYDHASFASYRSQVPQATPYLAHDASAELMRSALASLGPIKAAQVLVEVERAGPFVGGGYSWTVAFKEEDTRDDTKPVVSRLPTIGVQHVSITGTGARVNLDRREAYETSPREYIVSLEAPLPAERAEVQLLKCDLVEMTPTEAAAAGASFTIGFRGEMTAVSAQSTDADHFFGCTLLYTWQRFLLRHVHSLLCEVFRPQRSEPVCDQVSCFRAPPSLLKGFLCRVHMPPDTMFNRCYHQTL